jgi:pyruvate/2-oxoglutarate dehydrogenase complex dihydrolipoamide acyltransferase (E2) component
MDARQEALFEDLKSVIKVPVGVNPLLDITQAISLAKQHGILWRWAKDGPFYEFRWSPDNPPIRVPESQANMYLVKRMIQELSPDETPQDSKSRLEYDITPAAKKLLLEAGIDEPGIATVPGTGTEGRVTVGDVTKFLKENA